MKTQYNHKNAIRNYHDLKVLKERYKWEALLHEESMNASLTKFRYTFNESLRYSLRIYTQKLAFKGAKQLIKRIKFWRHRKKS